MLKTSKTETMGQPKMGGERMMKKRLGRVSLGGAVILFVMLGVLAGLVAAFTALRKS